MRSRAPNLSAIAVTLLLSLGICASSGRVYGQAVGEPAAANSELNTVVAGVTATQVTNHERVRPYTVLREYRLSSEKQSDAESEVVAEVNFMPPGKKDYSIQNTVGNGRGEKVVRRVLDHEAEMAGEWTQTAITEANYTFELLGREPVAGQNCYILQLTPKRDSRDLLKGKAWVDPSTYQIVRIEGEPARTPSWWVKSVKIVLQFADVRGMWMQTSAHADADVRLFGRHTLESHDLDVRTADAVAQARLPRFSQQGLNDERRPVASHTGVRSGRRPNPPVAIVGTVVR